MLRKKHYPDFVAVKGVVHILYWYPDIFGKFIANKRIEWDAYRTHVSAFELDRYLPIL